MTENVADPADQPSDSALAELLGPAAEPWHALLGFCSALPSTLTFNWKFYGQKMGWQLQVSDKKRAVLWLIPRQGKFVASLALREPAVAEVIASDLPQNIIDEIENAKVYPEGRPARVVVTDSDQLEVVKKLVSIKVNS